METNKTTRELAIEWWNGLRFITTPYDLPNKERLTKKYYGNKNVSYLMGDEIENIYLSENPQPNKEETPVKEHTGDLMDDANRYFHNHKQTFTGVNAGNYLDEEDFTIFARNVSRQNEELKQRVLVLENYLNDAINRIEFTEQYLDGKVDEWSKKGEAKAALQ